MRITWRVFGLLLSLAVALSLGCSRSEEKAQTQFEQAERLAGEGELDRATTLLGDLLQRYPKTRAAGNAANRLSELKAIERQVEKEALATLERVEQVLDGYRSFAGVHAAGLQELDGSGYFFDADYLVGIVPESLILQLIFSNGNQRAEVRALHRRYRIGFTTVNGGPSRRLSAAEFGVGTSPRRILGGGRLLVLDQERPAAGDPG